MMFLNFAFSVAILTATEVQERLNINGATFLFYSHYRGSSLPPAAIQGHVFGHMTNLVLRGHVVSVSVSEASTLTWVGHALLQLPECFSRQRADLVPESALAVQRQVPETRLPLAVSAQLVAGFAEAAVEAQVVSDAVLPAVGSRLEEREVLPGRETQGGSGASLALWWGGGIHSDLVKW